MRKERAEYAVAQAAANGRELHLAEGDDREARNERFRKADKKGGTNPDKQVDRELQKFLYGVDIALETEKQWDEKFKQVQGQ
jgi:salicylate hydroxylase